MVKSFENLKTGIDFISIRFLATNQTKQGSEVKLYRLHRGGQVWTVDRCLHHGRTSVVDYSLLKHLFSPTDKVADNQYPSFQ